MTLVDTAGDALPGVTLDVAGIGGRMGEGNLGFGGAGIGDYTGSLFSDRSFNDGVFARPAEPIVLSVRGLDPGRGYTVQVVSAGPTTQDHRITAASGPYQAKTSYHAVRADGKPNPVTLN